MIFPENMKPLPVAAIPDDEGTVSSADTEAFVSDRVVRQLLVGPMTVAADRPKAFLGDDFVGTPDVQSPFVSLARGEAMTDEPAKSFNPKGPHPALAEPRRAAPPVPRTEPEGGYGRRAGSERRWVLGMGVCMATLMVCSVLAGFIPIQFGSPVQEHGVETFHPQPLAPENFDESSLAFTGEDEVMP